MVTTFKGPLEAAGAVSPDASEEPAEELGASEDWGAALASPEEALFPVPPHAVKPKAAVMDNNSAASLEFVGTIPEMRKKGFAKAVCEKAVCDAFADGATIITIRAVNRAVANLYQSIGFKAY